MDSEEWSLAFGLVACTSGGCARADVRGLLIGGVSGLGRVAGGFSFRWLELEQSNDLTMAMNHNRSNGGVVWSRSLGCASAATEASFDELSKFHP